MNQEPIQLRDVPHQAAVMQFAAAFWTGNIRRFHSLSGWQNYSQQAAYSQNLRLAPINSRDVSILGSKLQILLIDLKSASPEARQLVVPESTPPHYNTQLPPSSLLLQQPFAMADVDMADAPSGSTAPVKKVAGKVKAGGADAGADGKKRFEVKKVRVTNANMLKTC